MTCSHPSTTSGRARIRAVLAQLEPTPCSIEDNLRRVEEVVRSYSGDLYIFPELYLSGYTCKDLFYRIALGIDSEPIERLRELSRERNCTIIVGFPELCELGYLYNSALIACKGVAHVYRKRHLPTFSMFNEHRWFKPFAGAIEPIDAEVARLGVAICYDMFFPEIFKTYALKGAEIIVVISASPDTSVPLFHALARARAIETTTFVIWVNTAGVLDGATFGGGSLAVAPLGTVVAELPRAEESIATVDLDMRSILRARFARPVIRDSSIGDAYELVRAYEEME
ncbi:MAG: carbon-nitrogen hydrolase family protein [Crenarchaeota archaeon]|nr:carbon-nitrogen hydrolase family protein [Thermoproteota archaeon]